MECRCLVCGNLLSPGSMFSEDPRLSEVCSDECAEVYFVEGGERGFPKGAKNTEQLIPPDIATQSR